MIAKQRQSRYSSSMTKEEELILFLQENEE